MIRKRVVGFFVPFMVLVNLFFMVVFVWHFELSEYGVTFFTNGFFWTANVDKVVHTYMYIMFITTIIISLIALRYWKNDQRMIV